MARISDRIRRRPADWDRFGHWAPGAAMLALALIVATLLAAGLTARNVSPETANPPQVASENAPRYVGDGERDTDLLLYRAIAERIAAGENYYAVAVDEQRARNFPVRPGLAVRLPTLAWLAAALGDWGMV
ncbi:MAG: hypothetical protein WBA68_07780, partial [Alteraurantiacibacter sp.]